MRTMPRARLVELMAEARQGSTYREAKQKRTSKQQAAIAKSFAGRKFVQKSLGMSRNGEKNKKPYSKS